jgi:hypothetical protein
MKKRESSFSLIELLLALLIFSIIGLLLYNMFATGLRVDSKSSYISRSYQEARLAFDAMTLDLENAIRYDFSASFPAELSFQGDAAQFHLVCPSSRGLMHVQYYLDLPDFGSITRTIVGQRVEKLKDFVISSKEESPIRFIMRHEIPLMQYLTKTKDQFPAEILSAGIKKEGLRFYYGMVEKDASGNLLTVQDLRWTDSWSEADLPAAVRVEMTLFDPQNPEKSMVLKRDIYLSPVEFKVN